MRRPIIAGNWKMYKSPSESIKFVSELKRQLKDIDDRDIVVIPPFTSIYPCFNITEGSNINLGAQNMYWEDEGAYTGEISPQMLVDCKCKFCIIGHSERRALFYETDEAVNKKIKSALKHEITPICCIGESLQQRESGETFKVIETQIKIDFAGLTKDQIADVIIAYEPIWAIGTGHTATPEQADEAHAFIRETLAGLYGNDPADSIRIQYGGSVKPENCDVLMAKPEIDGALVGGASLKVDSFVRIVKFKK